MPNCQVGINELADLNSQVITEITGVHRLQSSIQSLSTLGLKTRDVTVHVSSGLINRKTMIFYSEAQTFSFNLQAWLQDWSRAVKDEAMECLERWWEAKTSVHWWPRSHNFPSIYYNAILSKAINAYDYKIHHRFYWFSLRQHQKQAEQG